MAGEAQRLAVVRRATCGSEGWRRGSSAGKGMHEAPRTLRGLLLRLSTLQELDDLLPTAILAHAIDEDLLLNAGCERVQLCRRSFL